MTEQRCNRYDCAMYNKQMANGCEGLIDLPTHLTECKFYKTQAEMDSQADTQQRLMQQDMGYRRLCVGYGIKFKGIGKKSFNRRSRND